MLGVCHGALQDVGSRVSRLWVFRVRGFGFVAWSLKCVALELFGVVV